MVKKPQECFFNKKPQKRFFMLTFGVKCGIMQSVATQNLGGFAMEVCTFRPESRGEILPSVKTLQTWATQNLGGFAMEI